MSSTTASVLGHRSKPRYGFWFMGRYSSVLPGLLLSAALATAAISMAQLAWLRGHGLTAMTLSIVLGMGMGNVLNARVAMIGAPGFGFAKQNLLRLGIVLYGLRLTFQDVSHVGVAGVAVDALMVCSTFALACWLGIRVLRQDRETAMLIGAGSAICGAAAVMAVGPVVRARVEQVTVAVSTVVVFGSLAMFVYPALYKLGGQYELFHLSPAAYGVFAGSTIHELAQVMVAGDAVGVEATTSAVIAKMVRVMMLAPFLMALSAWLLVSRPSAFADEAQGAGSRARHFGAVIPWFAVGFIVMVGLRSLNLLALPAIGVATTIANALLVMAMAAIGLTTRLAALRNAGLKPLVLGAALFAWLLIGGALINVAVVTALGA